MTISFRQLLLHTDPSPVPRKHPTLDMLRFHQLHNQLFPGTHASLDWMRWFFNTSQKRAYGAFNGQQLVGVWCVEPKRLTVDGGQVIPVGRCFSVGIHPNYRRRNLFVELSQLAIEAERQHNEYDYILGFPQRGRPVVDGHLKAGWHRVQLISMLTATPENRQTSLTKASTVRSFSYTREIRHTELPGTFLETEKQLVDRWLTHPSNFYIVLSRGTGNYMVLKQYADVLHILDVFGSQDDVGPLLDSAVELGYRHRCCTVTMWCAQNDPYRPLVESLGFDGNDDSEGTVELLAVNINASSPLSFTTSHFQTGSEESF